MLQSESWVCPAALVWQKESKLAGTQYSVLMYLICRMNSENLAAVRPKEIARGLNMSLSRVTSAIRALVEEELLQELPSGAYRITKK